MADYSQLMSLEQKAKPVQPASTASLLANQQASKEVSQKTSKPENQKTNKPAKTLASKPENQQTTKGKKKYGSYLTEASISAIQMLAIQTKQKDHEVLQEIVNTYFSSRK